MASPAPPSNVTPTVDANDQITLTWDHDPTWFAFDGDDASLGGFNEGMWYSSAGSVDHFEIQLTRDANGWTDPSGGPTTVTHDGSTSYSASYGPNGFDSTYRSQVGIDSMFRFHVRAVNADGASDWVASAKVYTDPIPPHDVYMTRDGPNSITYNWTSKSDISNYVYLEYRKDTGSGYGSWSGFGWTGDNGSWTGTVSGRSELQEDARYQFRIRSERRDSNSDLIADSENVYADYGNSGNVFFEDDFESGDLSSWDSTSGSVSAFADESSNWMGLNGADEGTYSLRINDDGYVVKNLGDLSGETDVIVRAAAADGNSNNRNEFGKIQWYDGSSWNNVYEMGWVYNKQGWHEAQARIPSSYLSTDNRLRLRGFTSEDGDAETGFDRVVVSDILHEYTKPAQASNLSLDTTVEDEITANWTSNATIPGNVSATSRVFYRKTSESSKTGNGYLSEYAEQDTITGLDDGEEYWTEIDVFIRQFRRGIKEDFWHTYGPTETGVTILPSPSTPSISPASDTALDASWTDNADNEDGYHVLHNTDSPQGFENGFGNWYGGYTRSSTQSKDGSYSAYSDTSSTEYLQYDFTVPDGLVVLHNSLYVPAIPSDNYHISAYRSDTDWCGPHVSLKSGEIQYYDGSWQFTGFTPPTGEWVDFITVVDVSAQTFDFYVRTEQEQKRIINDGSFITRDTFDSGDNRKVRLKGGTDVDIYYDDMWLGVSDSAGFSADTTSHTITELTQDTQYSAKVEAYTEHVTSESPTTSGTTYLNEGRSITSHSTSQAASALREVDLLEGVSSHGTASVTDSIRVIDVLTGNNTASVEFYNTQSYYDSNGHPTTTSELDEFYDAQNSGVEQKFDGLHTRNTVNHGDRTQSSTFGTVRSLPSYITRENGYSWKLSTTFTAPETGTYTFGIDGDDAMDIAIDGQIVTSWYGGHGFDGTVTNHEGTIDLTEGSDYAVTLRYEEGSGGSGMTVGWQKPSDSSYHPFPVDNSSTSAPISSGAATVVDLGESVTSSATSMSASADGVIDLSVTNDSHAGAGATSTERVVSLLSSPDSHATAMDSSVIRVVDLLESVTSAASPMDSSVTALRTLIAAPSSHGRAGSSATQSQIDLTVTPLSQSNPMDSTTTRGALTMEGRNSTTSHFSGAGGDVAALISTSVLPASHSTSFTASADRGKLNNEGRASPSYATAMDSETKRVVDLGESVASEGNGATSFAYSDRVSLEMIDYEIFWDDSHAVWYTNWFEENRLSPDQDTMAVRSLVVDNAKEPAATIKIQYDNTGDGEVDAESEPIELERDQMVKEVHDIPLDQGGRYRIKIMEYSGYNSLYAIDTAIVH